MDRIFKQKQDTHTHLIQPNGNVATAYI